MQFYISKIKLDPKTKHIAAVAAYKPGFSTAYWIPRQFVAQLIDQGVPFNTRFKKNGEMVTGARVEVYEGDFLRTVANGTEKDNLESLPTF